MTIITYSKVKSVRATPQSLPIPGKDMVQNSTGAYSFKADIWKRLDRFLILGTEGGSFYASEHKLTEENANSVLECIGKDGVRVVKRIVEISDKGLAPKNDPAIFALALCMTYGNEATKHLATDSVSKVCRIGTHIFHLAECINQMRGWGRAAKRIISRWYENLTPEQMALQFVKYQQRDGWSHKDLLRLSHNGKRLTKPSCEALVRWAIYRDLNVRKVKKPAKAGEVVEKTYPKLSAKDLPEIIEGFEELMACKKEKEAVKLIQTYKLPRECVPTELLNSKLVWEALLYAGEGMPMTAMIRNLAKMTQVGLLSPASKAASFVLERLLDEKLLQKARIHPIQVLSAYKTYGAGHGERGKLSWTPVASIASGLEKAFYKSFKFVEPSNKRLYLALDVSGSMGSGTVGGTSLTPREASGVLAMVTLETERDYVIKGFQDRLLPLAIRSGDKIEHVTSYLSSLSFGSTDCALPMQDALKNKMEVDTFIVYTDSETGSGPGGHNYHPSQALREYRKKINPNAKLIVVGMVANEFSIADPDDARMLDIVGFSADCPALISQFAKEE